MVSQTVFLLDWEWICKVFYEAGPDDAPIVLDELKRIGCKGSKMRDARNMLLSGKKNTGLTYSNYGKYESVIVISNTTSADEFQDTFDHEKGHLVKNICKKWHINPFGEECEYLAGEVGKQMFKVAKKFMCDHCRKDQ